MYAKNFSAVRSFCSIEEEGEVGLIFCAEDSVAFADFFTEFFGEVIFFEGGRNPEDRCFLVVSSVLFRGVTVGEEDF